MEISWIHGRPKADLCVFMACNREGLPFAHYLADHISKVEKLSHKVFDIALIVSPGFKEQILLDDSNLIVGELSGFNLGSVPLRSPIIKNPMPIETYFRFMAIPALSRFFNKALYLDTDIRLKKGAINDLLFAIKMEHAIASSPDFPLIQDMESCSHQYIKNLNLPESSIYRSAGVLLIDIEKFMEWDVWGRMCEVIAKHSDILFYLDQSLLNKTLCSEMDLLSPIYNWHANFMPEKFIVPPKILHYTGHMKPWGFNSEKSHFHPDLCGSYVRFKKRHKQYANSTQILDSRYGQKYNSFALNYLSHCNRLRKKFAERRRNMRLPVNELLLALHEMSKF